MDYKHITNFLEKFKKTLFKKEEIYKNIIETIFKHTSILIEAKSIKIKNTNIYIKETPIIRSEILIKKEKIISDLEKLIIGQKITDIK